MIGVEEGKSPALLAEMKLPGTATLNFEMRPAGGERAGDGVGAGAGARTKLTMTARFRPKGVLGILYWCSVLPLHNIVFGGMLRGIRRAAEVVSGWGSRDTGDDVKVPSRAKELRFSRVATGAISWSSPSYSEALTWRTRFGVTK